MNFARNCTLESIGGVLLILGLLVRSMAILFIVQMAVAWYVSVFIIKKPFLSLGRPDWDVIALLAAGALSSALNGGGKLALDTALRLRSGTDPGDRRPRQKATVH